MTIKDVIETEDYPKNEENFNKLASLCKSGNIVPFIGAGLSLFVGLPSWQGFIDELKEKCPDKNFPTENLLKAADEIEKQLGKEEFYKIFKQTFQYDKSDDWWEKVVKENGVEKQAVSIIPDLFNGPIITTNFDKILEAVHQFSPPVALPDNVSLLKNANKERKHLIYKVHGCVSNPDKVIFTGKSYKEGYYKPDSPLVKTLSEFYKGFCFLFLGSSLKLSENEMDESIKLWTKLTKSGMFHYAILACSKEDENTRRAELEKQQIYPIFFPEGKFESIKIILDELLERKNESVLKAPEYNSEFIVREVIQKKLKQHLWNEKNSISVLTGMGGVGKTRIACEYQKKYQKEYLSGTYFFRAISKENIQAEIFRFAVEKELVSEKEKNQTLILQKVRSWMNDNSNWLFILDNVEHYKHIEALLKIDTSIANGKRHFLITTRKRNLPFNNTIHVTILNKNEARDFFNTHVKKQNLDNYADSIAKTLGYLPLALEQATAYIVKQGITYKEYINALKNNGLLEVLNKGNHEDGTLAVGATYNLSLRMLEYEESRQLLNLCSFFAPDNIHSSWFIGADDELPKPLSKAVKDEIVYNNIINELYEYSLINFENDKFSIHRIVQDVILNNIKKAKTEWRNFCLSILNKLCYKDFSTIESRTNFRVLALHINSVTDGINHKKSTEKTASCYSFLGKGFYELGDYSQALKYHKKAKNIQEGVLWKNDVDMARTYNEIALIYNIQDKFDDALRYYKKSLDILHVLEDNKPENTATVYNNIALVYEKRGDYNCALEYHDKAIDIREKEFGDDHPETAISYNNIAGVHYTLGDYECALEYHKKAKNIRESRLDKDHPETARTYNNMGKIYCAKGDYKLALEYLEKAKNIREKVLGKKHIETALVYDNIALVNEATGDFACALKWHLEAFFIRIKVLGEKHHDAKSNKKNMLKAYKASCNAEPFIVWLKEQMRIFRNSCSREQSDI